MSMDIYEPGYWSQRAKKIYGDRESRHHAVFVCGVDVWKRIEERHREILRDKIRPNDSILDFGCGWGRLLNLLPEDWKGDYLGVDHCPEFIERARDLFPERKFILAPFHDIIIWSKYSARFDWAVLISIKPMVIRHKGQEEWDLLEGLLKQVSERILFLEYDPEENPLVVEGFPSGYY